MTRERGFTIVELAVTITVVAVLAAIAAPYIGTTISTSRARTVVSKFSQDFAWLRNAAGTGTRTVTLALNADCSWTGTVDGVTDASHSMSTVQLQQSTSGMTCAGQSMALPITFTFNGQGFVTPSATFTFTGLTGQTWPMRALGSGTLTVMTAGN